MSAQASTMSSMAMRVAIRLWWASRRTSSVTPISRGLLSVVVVMGP